MTTRAARIGLAPHWAALTALALLLVAGLAVLDDYGVTFDEGDQRLFATRSLAYIRGEDESFASAQYYVKLYGVALELPVLLAGGAFGLEGDRAVHVFRHLITHLFFLTGGCFAYLLSLRLFGNRIIALLAMLIFLLHPRLYAHSFFNSKDIPFFAMFIIAFYLTHRAFRRESVSAFVLLGVGVGALMNLRVPGVMLFAAIPAMRALDFLAAQGRAERKRALVTTGAFALAGGLTAFALSPYIWGDPIARAAEWLTTLSDHPYAALELFNGALYRSVDFPAAYLPTWVAISSPPFALLAALVGAGATLAGWAKAPRRGLRNTRLRFGLLAAACFGLPLFAVMLLDSNVYNGWRQAYFLWAPLSLLAAFGLQWLASASAGARLRAGVYAAAGAGAAATLIAMAFIHPNQQVSFNFLVDRVTPERLGTQYTMEYWGHPILQAWKSVLDARPSGDAAASAANYYPPRLIEENARVLPRADRDRIGDPSGPNAFVIRHGLGERSDLAEHRLTVYGNTILTIERKDDPQAAYMAATQRELIIDAAYDVYRSDNALTLVKEPCAPSFMRELAFRLRVTPVNADDLPHWRRAEGFESLSAPLSGYGALHDGKCVVSVPLPDYPIANLEIRWSPELVDDAEAREAARLAVESGQLAARSIYAIYLADGGLVYIQEPCAPDETEHRFFLHVTPERADDLPAERRRYGFDNLDFEFFWRGALLDKKCVASVPLPDYPIESARTGQYISGEGEIWSAEFAVPE